MVKKNKKDYAIGETTEGGAKITGILGASEEFIVYLISPSKLHWEKSDSFSASHFSRKLAVFNVLNARIEASIAFNKPKSKLKYSLGQAFYAAVMDKNSDWEAHFHSVAEQIDADCGVYCRGYYVVSVCIAVLMVVVATEMISLRELSTNDAHFVSAVAAGAIGAMLSSLTRIRAMHIPNFSTANRQALHAFIRILFGATAGFVLVVLIKGELVFPDEKDKAFSLFALSVIAGFSERFLPNLLSGQAGDPGKGDDSGA